MTAYLIDNNIWVAHEMGYPDVVNYLKRIVSSGNELHSNTIIEMELMSHFEVAIDESIKMGRERYISLIDKTYPIDQQIARKAAEIRREAKLTGHKVPKGPDALIAATASIYHLKIVSNNDIDFVWASQNFDFTYINPISSKDHYHTFQEEYKERRRLK
ncbi:hypothetical protein JCM9140_4274 [Halalkalibacter wakoensis JCM 9140]|uniref:PIN domain-containing protein n=1 Tax=Halalkalibacter wakoensis JCM 9140 TaxID=1236970 RepID=W4Q7W1_9BACI|nr:PIN domain-containing protein [Halalkalibacter wakoensis]GAE28082.1 hypothetical protein JCM9140_4274 [Halalkalibacter wakoensis JCM 9140]